MKIVPQKSGIIKIPIVSNLPQLYFRLKYKKSSSVNDLVSIKLCRFSNLIVKLNLGRPLIFQLILLSYVALCGCHQRIGLVAGGAFETPMPERQPT